VSRRGAGATVIERQSSNGQAGKGQMHAQLSLHPQVGRAPQYRQGSTIMMLMQPALKFKSALADLTTFGVDGRQSGSRGSQT
jgi:hypothetical protein